MVPFLNRLATLFGARPALDPTNAARLAAWRRQPAPRADQALDAGRLVVLDVESTGLDLARDRLIAIGAIAVVDGRIALADSFETILRQDEVSDRDNILVHGIGGEAQRKGLPPAEALLDFLDWLGDAPLIAYHVAFDRTMIQRALHDHLGVRLPHPWLDLAYVLPELLPQEAARRKALDHWTAYFGIANYARHSALADALATAELLLAALPLARARGMTGYRQLQDAEAAQRWLGANR